MRLDWYPDRLKLWDTDEAFQRIFQRVFGKTMIDVDRLYVLYGATVQTAHLAGSIAELGVFMGGSAKLLALACPQKKIHLFDTFEGLPDAQIPGLDAFGKGKFAWPEGKTRALLEDCKNVEFHVGIFPDTAVSDLVYCLVHIDVDIYQSAHDACSWFWPRLVPGGMMVFDDYGWTMTRGVKKAVDEYFAARSEHPISLPNGQCLVTKL